MISPASSFLPSNSPATVASIIWSNGTATCENAPAHIRNARYAVVSVPGTAMGVTGYRYMVGRRSQGRWSPPTIEPQLCRIVNGLAFDRETAGGRDDMRSAAVHSQRRSRGNSPQTDGRDILRPLFDGRVG